MKSTDKIERIRKGLPEGLGIEDGEFLMKCFDTMRELFIEDLDCNSMYDEEHEEWLDYVNFMLDKRVGGKL
jgi:hypothetical protein